MAEVLAAIAQRARRIYAERVARTTSSPHWWTAVVVTASSRQQAERYRWEIEHRQEHGTLPAGVAYLVAPDPPGQRLGSGGATLNGLRVLMEHEGIGPDSTEKWWSGQRVLMLHAGGDSRQLPQYALSGKLFSALPVKTPWGEMSTVFDEMLALSSAWAEAMPTGLLVSSGDVILVFDAGQLAWDRPGVCGVAIRQPAASGMAHGVYVADDEGRVYAYLQKPSVAEIKSAGGLLPGNEVALDTGLLRFDSPTAAELTKVSRSMAQKDVINLYLHVTMALTDQWRPAARASAGLKKLYEALRTVPFWCSTVTGDFTHIGTTTGFRRLMTEDTEFSRLYAAGQLGVRPGNAVIDSVLAEGNELGAGALVIECNLDVPVRAGRGALLHGLECISGPVDIPDDTVVHQLQVITKDGTRGTVIRVFGVQDDPQARGDSWTATWLGAPMLEQLRDLGLELSQVWPGIPPESWSLWNAQLFPVTTPEEAWNCALWLMRMPGNFTSERWSALPRLSLAGSTEHADPHALLAARARRAQINWQAAARTLAVEGSDIRPLLAHSPGIGPLAAVGKLLLEEAKRIEETQPAEAASRYYQAGMFFGQAGLEQEATSSREDSFAMVARAVAGARYDEPEKDGGGWQADKVEVSAPARIDLGGGWSDTPPFCLDWGGTVLNVAVELNGDAPIQVRARRLDEPLVRCVHGRDGGQVEYRQMEEVLRPPEPGDQFSIVRTALQMTGLFERERVLPAVLERLGGGLQLETAVDLPMGSGLGTSSILAAAVVRALEALRGRAPGEQMLSDQVMNLEQRMTTGGGWQDQAGGIYAGAKLVTSGPGLRQRLRSHPVDWSPEGEAEFERLMVLYYTGIRRMAKDLLKEVVGRYLARETAAVQVLHSLKTLAMEMWYAMRAGEWDHLGQLLDRHWALNQILDPHTTNSLINSQLELVRPFIRGAKLCGAGGGGFLMLLARSENAAAELRAMLARESAACGGAVYPWRISRSGLRVMAE